MSLNEEIVIPLNKLPGKLVNGYIVCSPIMDSLFALIEKFAPSDMPVMISGETGCGKEGIANALHQRSKRKGKLVSVNVASIPTDLFEAELFGYEKGIFTGADRSKAGLIEDANAGTLFLDEITEMPMACQKKILRVLQEKKVRRLGGREEKPVDIRIISATNRSIQNWMEEGKFAEDLYYRLSHLMLKIPPLRERKEDLIALTLYYTNQFSAQYQKPIKAVEAGTLMLLESYEWPGNIRELMATLHKGVIMAEGEYLKPEHILFQTPSVKQSFQQVLQSYELPDLLELIKKEKVRLTLKQSSNNKRIAARRLNMSESQLYAFLKKNL